MKFNVSKWLSLGIYLSISGFGVQQVKKGKATSGFEKLQQVYFVKYSNDDKVLKGNSTS